MAVIELVSAGNKDSQTRARSFETKIVELLESGLHVVIVDVFAPTAASATGFPAAVARRLGAENDPPLGERYAASFEVALEPPRLSLYARELVLGQALPGDVPLFLAPGDAIDLPLEASYEATFARLPASDRAAL